MGARLTVGMLLIVGISDGMRLEVGALLMLGAGDAVGTADGMGETDGPNVVALLLLPRANGDPEGTPLGASESIVAFGAAVLVELTADGAGDAVGAGDVVGTPDGVSDGMSELQSQSVSASAKPMAKVTVSAEPVRLLLLPSVLLELALLSSKLSLRLHNSNAMLYEELR